MLNRPRVKRMYYGILKGMIDDFFFTGGNSPLSAYISRVSSAGVGNTGTVSSFANRRTNYRRDRVNAACFPSVRLRITTNGGRDITHEGAEPFIDIDGESPADVFVLAVSRNGEFLDEIDFEFSTRDLRDWSIDDIPLVAGANELEILGFNASGDIVDTDSVTVTSTVGWDRPTISTAQPNPIGQSEILTLSGRDFHEGVVAVLPGVGDVLEVDVEFDPDNPGTARLVIPGNLDPGIHQQPQPHAIGHREVLEFLAPVINSDNAIGQGTVHIANDKLNVGCGHLDTRQSVLASSLLRLRKTTAVQRIPIIHRRGL